MADLMHDDSTRHGDFAVPVEYLQPIAEQLASRDADVAEWLRASGVAGGALSAAGTVIAYPTFRRLVLDALTA